MGLDVLGVAIEETVVHARLGERRVFLHVEKPGEFLLARVPDFHHARPVAEMQARSGEVRGQRCPAEGDFLPDAIDEVAQKGQLVGVDDILFRIGAQSTGSIATQTCFKLFAHVFQDGQLSGFVRSSLGQGARRHASEEARDLGRKGSIEQGEVQLRRHLSMLSK